MAKLHHALAGCAALAALLAPVPAGAEGVIDEVRVGALMHGLGPFSDRKEKGADINAEVLLRPLYGLSAIGAPRPTFGASIATEDGATSQIYGMLTWEQHLTPRFFVDAGAGIAVHDGETSFDPMDPNIATTKYLGCRALFRLSGDVGYMLTKKASVSFHMDHISNAGLCSENEGLDNLGIRLGLRF
ncbi:MAG: acyloxyacyl hydrolase [Parvularculaceae bacterium]